MNMTKSEKIIDGLKARLANVTLAAKYSELPEVENQNYYKFYQEIAFFYHYMTTVPECKQLLLELFAFNKKLEQNKDYQLAKESSTSAIQEIGKEILNHSDYEQFKQGETANYKNPFVDSISSSTEVLINLHDLLTQLKEFEYPDRFGHGVNLLLDGINSTLQAVSARWCRRFNSVIEENAIRFEIITKCIKLLEFHENFERDFLGIKSALNIAAIHSSLNPKGSYGTSTYEYMINDLIQEGKAIRENSTVEELLTDCNKVFQYISESLSINISIQTAIDRFSNYMVLYGNVKINGAKSEKELQRKFEEFLFLEGYYPISEAQLSNGRIDTLAIDQNSAFLCEFKQFNLGKVKENQKQAVIKLVHGSIQGAIYNDRLQAYPNIAKTVYIIIFSDTHISFKNNIDRLEYNNLTFVFKSIELLETVPSKTKSKILLDVKYLLNNETEAIS